MQRTGGGEGEGRTRYVRGGERKGEKGIHVCIFKFFRIAYAFDFGSYFRFLDKKITHNLRTISQILITFTLHTFIIFVNLC